MPQLKLSLLGPPRVEWDGQPVVLSLRRGLALLAYLALSDRPRRRDELCALLWPDADEREARSRLRHTLHRTGELFGSTVFDSAGDAVCLSHDMDLWIDTRELERWVPDGSGDLAHVAELRAAADHYRGDLLSGFTLPDGAPWEDWLFLERERLRRLAGQAFEALAEAEMIAGEWELGLNHARQLLALDRLHEPAHRLLMTLYASSGQQAAALRQFDECARILKRELDVEPDRETLELRQRIRSKQLAPEPLVRQGDRAVRTQGPETSRQPGELVPIQHTGSAGANNLPTGMSRYVGRETERTKAHEVLQSTHLLTLTGPGGIGKTRFAIELASAELQSAQREVRFVELASLGEAARVPATVASALGVADASGQPTVDTLIRALRDRQVLLVLDNCEHLVQPCASLLDDLLHGCAGVSVLATSREPLGLSWETVWPMSPLEIPVNDAPGGAGGIASIESVQLFIDRARMLRPSFALNDDNAWEVAEICRRLDGIPLAIELAAARLRVLSPRQILERLDDRFHLLTGGARTAPARHQTLAATIDWSHHLLTEAEQVLFRRLAVFAGGWTLEAAEAVCDADPLAREDVLDLLASLVDKSLVTVDVRHTTTRYRLLDTIRAFALDRLRESQDEAPTRQRQQAWVLALLREAAYPLWGPEQGQWMARMDLEIDNIRTALDWCSQDWDSVTEVLERCTFSLYRYWDVRGSSNEARSRLAELLARAPDDAALGGIAQTQAYLAHFYMLSGSPREAHDRALAAAALARSANDPWALIQTLLVCTIIHGLLHDFDQVPILCEEGLEVARAINHPFGSAPWNYWLGEVACLEGRLDEGERLLEECQLIVSATGDSREVSTVKFVQGHAALLRGDLPRALALIQESLIERFNAADAQVVPHCLDAVGWVASAHGEPERAARLLGAAQAAAVAGGVILLPIWQADRDRATSEALELLGKERFDELMEEGRALNLGQAVALALSEQESA